MADFIQALDAGRLVFAETALAFAISPFVVPAYNLPILLFGSYVLENNDAAQAQTLFAGLLSVSIVYDLVWMFRHEQAGLLRLLTVVLFLLKIPTTAAFLTQRGRQFPGLDGDTVWSMPGGFTSRGGGGYQTVADDPRQGATVPPPESVC